MNEIERALVDMEEFPPKTRLLEIIAVANKLIVERDQYRDRLRFIANHGGGYDGTTDIEYDGAKCAEIAKEGL